MARKTAEGGEKTKKGAMLLPAAVVAFGLVGGGFMMSRGGAASPPSAATGHAEPTTTTTEPAGPTVALEPITLNLADGRFLKVGLAFQLAAGDKGGGGHEADKDADPTAQWARALDAAIEVLGGRTYNELVSPGGRQAVKEALTTRLQEDYHGELRDVYFTQFVMQ